MLNYDMDADSETNAINMLASAEKIGTGQITFAARDSEFDGYSIKKGELMALLGGKITFVDTDLSKTVMKLLKQMIKRDSQFVTVIYGADVTESQAADIEAQIQEKYGSKTEITVINGGQPIYYYIISVE
jgi:dihydroxyacetone kinase-like predicted kinase